MDGLTRAGNGARNLLRLIAPRAYHPERNALRGARTHARHLPQLHDQVPDRRRIFGSSHAIPGRTARGAPGGRALPRFDRDARRGRVLPNLFVRPLR